MTPCLVRQARKLARAKRMIRQGYTKVEAARRVGWTRQWLNRLLAEERMDLAEAS